MFTKTERLRIKSKAGNAGRKFSDYSREILLNGEVAAVPKMTANERGYSHSWADNKVLCTDFQPHQGQG
jgi:hypothetical protein